MRTIYETSTEDFIIADSAEHAIKLLLETNPDANEGFDEPLSAKPVKRPTFAFHCEKFDYEQIPEPVRSFAVQKDNGDWVTEAPLEEWAKCEPSYLASLNY